MYESQRTPYLQQSMQHHHVTISTCWCYFTHKPQRKQYICLFFIPSFTQCDFCPLIQPLCTLSPFKNKKCDHGNKSANNFLFLYKSLKYITRPGKRMIWKTYTLKYFQLKITNNYHLHFAIFNNLFFTKLFLWRSLFNRNSWLKLSTSIYGFCKQSTMLLAQCNTNKKSLLSFTWGEMEHMQIQRVDSRIQEDFIFGINRTKIKCPSEIFYLHSFIYFPLNVYS